mmetsp:Transcript_41380/g.110732  ORF Transcript_41380/g.110732 Transcript_41380/m.110732 type:complete len:278 (-) Transcript_41380:610-1443(-)
MEVEMPTSAPKPYLPPPHAPPARWRRGPARGREARAESGRGREGGSSGRGRDGNRETGRARRERERGRVCAAGEPEAVGEARAAVPVHACGVDLALEHARRRSVLRHDAVRVPRPVLVDVGHGLGQVAHHLDRQHLVAVLGGPVRLRRRLEAPAEDGGGGGAEQQLHALGLAALREGRQELPRRRLVDEEGLDGVAGGGVLRLGVHCDVQRLALVRLGVDEDVAHAVGVAKHRDVRVAHHVLHEVVGPARDDEVHVLLHLEQLRRLLARREQRHHVG